MHRYLVGIFIGPQKHFFCNGCSLAESIVVPHCGGKVLVTESKLNKIELVIWIGYLVLPVITQWLAYQPLPDEYRGEKHELLESHFEECGPEGLRSCEVPDTWRDDQTGKIYTADQFTGHHRSEAKRVGITAFAYGLIGCLFFAYGRAVRGRDTFIRAIAKATVANIFISLFLFWLT